jgi:hypothetical protein
MSYTFTYDEMIEELYLQKEEENEEFKNMLDLMKEDLDEIEITRLTKIHKKKIANLQSIIDTLSIRAAEATIEAATVAASA